MDRRTFLIGLGAGVAAGAAGCAAGGGGAAISGGVTAATYLSRVKTLADIIGAIGSGLTIYDWIRGDGDDAEAGAVLSQNFASAGFTQGLESPVRQAGGCWFFSQVDEAGIRGCTAFVQGATLVQMVEHEALAGLSLIADGARAEGFTPEAITAAVVPTAVSATPDIYGTFGETDAIAYRTAVGTVRLHHVGAGKIRAAADLPSDGTATRYRWEGAIPA